MEMRFSFSWVLLVFCLFVGEAYSAEFDPRARGVFFEDRNHQYFKVLEKVDPNPILDAQGRPIRLRDPEFGIEPFTPSDAHATKGGMTYYPFSLNETYDRIPEYDPIRGTYFGPAGFRTQWNWKSRILTGEYSNGFFSRREMIIEAPRFLDDVVGAWIDFKKSVFWVRQAMSGSVRLYHESIVPGETPVNELFFGDSILKVRGAPDGKGVLVLLSNGQGLWVEMGPSYEFRVRELNVLSQFRLIDFETGPLGVDPFHYSLVLMGIETKTGQVALRVFDDGAQKSYPVALRYQDAFRRILSPDFFSKLEGNVAEVPLSSLVVDEPGRLSKWMQLHYQARESEIRERLRDSNSDEPLKRLIRRKEHPDSRPGGLCRSYLLLKRGLGPDVFLN